MESFGCKKVNMWDYSVKRQLDLETKVSISNERVVTRNVVKHG